MYRYLLVVSLSILLTCTLSLNSKDNSIYIRNRKGKARIPTKEHGQGDLYLPEKQGHKRTLKVFEKETESVPYIVLPPDNSLPEINKEVKKMVTSEIPTVYEQPTHSPIPPTTVATTLKPSTQKPININIVMPTAAPVKHQTPLSGSQTEKQNTTTINLNLNLGGTDTVKEQSRPIILQLPPTQRIVVPPPTQQLQAQVNPNNYPIGQVNPNTLTSSQLTKPLLGLQNAGLQGTLQSLVNSGMPVNYPGINTQSPLIGSNTNFPGIGSTLPGINGIIPGVTTGINSNFPPANYPGINTQSPLIGSNTNFPGIGSTLPGINGIIPGVTTGINSNFPLPGVNSNFQGYPANSYNPQMVQQLSSVISESIKSSLALSQPDLIASALQKLAIQTQNQNQPERLLSTALTQALAKTVGESSDTSQEQKLVNSLATALSMLRNGGATLGTGTGATPVTGASYPSLTSPSGTPLKVEVVNLPQQYVASQAPPLTGKFQAPYSIPVAQPAAPPPSISSDDIQKSSVGKITANTLGKAMAKALVSTAKKIVSGVQRDRILKFKEVEKLSKSLNQFFKDSLYKRKNSSRFNNLGHGPFIRKYLRDHSKNCCCCCMGN